jgi:cell division protein FtsB
MVVRTRLRAFIRQLALFLGAASAIAYFGFHAVNGNHGMMARRHYEEQKRELSLELGRLKEDKAALERRVALLKAESLDPDMLDEKAREMLGLASPSEVVVLLPR